MQDHFYESQRQRYSRLLTLVYSKKYWHGIYTNFDKSFALLNEVFALSQTTLGRDQILKIDANILGRLLATVKIEWHKQPWRYRQVDNVILRIMANLVLDPRFYVQTLKVKSQLKQISGYCPPKPEWKHLCNIVYQNINSVQKRIKQETPVKQFKLNFATRQQAIEEMSRHRNYNDFSKNQIHFKQLFPIYINMLRAALKVGAKQQVTTIFPNNGCFGCIILSMIDGGYQAGQEKLSVIFLNELTDGWFTSELYGCIISKIKIYSHSIGKDYDYQDRQPRHCYIFDETMNRYLEKIGKMNQLGKLVKYRKIGRMMMLEQELDKIKCKQKHQQQISQIDISKIVNHNQAKYIQNLIIDKMKKLGLEYSRISLRYSYKSHIKQQKLKLFINEQDHHTLLVAKCRSGKIIGGYFVHSLANRQLTGGAWLFSLDPNLCLCLGQLAHSYQIINEKQENAKGILSYEMQSSSDDQQVKDIEGTTHKLTLQIEDEIFRLYLSVKQESKKIANASWKEFIQSIPNYLITGQNQLEIQIVKLEIYSIEARIEDE